MRLDYQNFVSYFYVNLEKRQIAHQLRIVWSSILILK